MYKKIIRPINQYITKNWLKLIGSACAIAIAVTCLGITVLGKWGNVFYYPEDKLQILEQEALDIIQNEDFNREGYTCTTMNYNFKTKEGNMRISNGSLYVNAMMENGKIEVKRPSKFLLFLIDIMLLVLIPSICSIAICLILLILWEVICYIIFIISKILKE